jgi:hypothetical protein
MPILVWIATVACVFEMASGRHAHWLASVKQEKRARRRE